MRSGAEGGRCPHCKSPVPKEHGRSCLECGGSLQKRYLAIGCLSSKPMVLLAVGVPLWLARDGGEARAEPSANASSAEAFAEEREADAALGSPGCAPGRRDPATAR